MCGIVGLMLRDGRVEREQIDRMNDTIVHRGPDGDGVFVQGNVGIGMRRLSIIDLEGGWQPIANETGTVQVVHNGEIYNYRELRTELEELGHHFKTESDTEAIVHAYEQWGGFEFANGCEACSGSPFGTTTPASCGSSVIVWASSPCSFRSATKVLLSHRKSKPYSPAPVVNKTIEPSVICDYLTFGSADRNSSFLKGVRQLLPGHTLRVSEGLETRVEPYWEYRTPETRLDVTEPEAVEMVLEKLRDSIRAHLVADVPVGAFLSGGVDSSAIVAAMVELTNAKLKTFSIGFEEARFNELEHARKVAEKWGCEHHELIVRPDAVEIVEEIMGHFDEPFADASAIPTWFVSKLAAEHVKVVLSGDGGDELYAGYTRYKTAYQRLWLDQIPKPARQAAAWAGALLPSFAPGKYFLGYSPKDRGPRFVTEHELFPYELRKALLRPEYSPEGLGRKDPRDIMGEHFRDLATGDYVADCMAFDITRYLPMDILTKVDRMTMAHSLEARPPLLDHEFVEFSASLPTSLKFKSAHQQKYVLRKALRSLVPAEVMDRPKAGFSVPLPVWFAGPLAPMFRDTVLQQGRCLEFLNEKVIRRVFRENLVGRRDHGLRLWSILMLELWLRGLDSSTSQLATQTVAAT